LSVRKQLIALDEIAAKIVARQHCAVRDVGDFRTFG